MEVPVSKLVRLDGRERRNEPEPEERAASAATSAPTSTAATTIATPAPTADASGSATAVTPSASGLGVSAGPDARAEPRARGFTSVIRHLSLYGWLRWLHSNRSDATLHVSTDAGSGTIWCSAGVIIDAEWGGHVAEAALREMLPRSSGAVTIDFDPVQHPRRIVTPTHQLLHLAADDAPSSAANRGHGEASSTASATEPARKDRFAELAMLLAESVAPVAGPTSPPPAHGRGWLRRRRGYLAGAVVIAGLAVAGFAVGRLRATGLARSSASGPAVAPASSAPSQPAPMPSASAPTIITPRPRELPSIPFVSIEVEPRDAEIWLDRELAGRGALQLAAIHDGMMHELRFMAPGHETKTLFFRDAPPAGRVVLNRVDEQVLEANPAAASTAPRGASNALRTPPAETPATRNASRGVDNEPPRRVARQRASPSAASSPPSRSRPVPPPPSSQTKPSGEKSPRVELIEVHTPRVQLLD